MENNKKEENTTPEVLQVFASEDIKTTDVPPGTAAPAASEEEKEAKMKADEEKTLQEYNRLMGRYVEPHNKKSRWVTEADVERMVKDGNDLVMLCALPRGNHQGVAALAHPQIESEDPLRFFVLPNGMIVVNPVIINHTKVPVFKTEGCMSYPDHKTMQMVPRYHKVVVRFQSIIQFTNPDGTTTLGLSPVSDVSFSGMEAHVFQHECSHLNGHNLYDADFDPLYAIGFGDHLIFGSEEDEQLTKRYIVSKRPGGELPPDVKEITLATNK